MSSKKRIDVHHHLIPPAFVQAMDKYGLKTVAGAPLPKWDVQKSLETMMLNGIETALLSLSATGVYFGNAEEACDLARRCNEFSAEIVAAHRQRLGWFAVLPMPLTDAACREAVYALDHMGADGIVLLGSSDGYFLGDTRFDELMAELDQRQTVVFVHPNLHATSQTLNLDIPGFFLEFLCDTSRAASNLILQGTIERYPNIRWILAHAGGFLPYVAWRLSLSNMFPEYAKRAPQGFLNYVRRFYFDTALSPSPYALAALNQLVDPSHIVFGSDFPFAPAPVVALETKQLDTLTVIDDATRQAIERDNALRLFPKYANTGESVGQVDHYPSGLGVRLRKWAIKPVITAADYIRNR